MNLINLPRSALYMDLKRFTLYDIFYFMCQLIQNETCQFYSLQTESLRA